MKVLIAGLGSIGMRHARNFRLLGVDELIGMDPDEGRRQRFVAEFSTPAYADLTAALTEAPRLSVISSPNRFHISQALACAESGSHLFIEKPLAISHDGLADLQSVVQRRSLFAHVGSNWKFHPAFRAMKELVTSGALGSVTVAQVIAGQWLPDWHPWEDYRQSYSARQELGGGIVFDSHEFDYLPWIMGPVRDIVGFTGTTGALQIDTEDMAVACLQFVSGALATIQVDYIQRDYRRRYHIAGERGTAEWDYRRGTVVHFDAASKESREIPCHLEDINEMYVEQARHILAGVAGQAAPVTSIADARTVLDLLLRLKGN